jgi:hypothetical protein
MLRRLQEEDLVTASVRGVGLGLRWEFLDELVARTAALDTEGADKLPIDFIEVSPENYMRRGGRYPSALAWIAHRYAVVSHGLTMSLGGTDPLDGEYLSELAATLTICASARSAVARCTTCSPSPSSARASRASPIAFAARATQSGSPSRSRT